MATISTKAAEAVRGYANVSLESMTSLEAATQTFLKGNFVIGDTSGYVAIIASDNDGDALGVAARAGQNGTSAGDKTSEFVFLQPGIWMKMNLLAASDAAHTLAQTDLWAYAQWQTTSSHHVLDVTATTPRFYIVKIGLGAAGDAYGDGGIGDSNARVLAMPVGSMLAVQPDA